MQVRTAFLPFAASTFEAILVHEVLMRAFSSRFPSGPGVRHMIRSCGAGLASVLLSTLAMTAPDTPLAAGPGAPPAFAEQLQQLVRNHPRTRAEVERLSAALARSRYRGSTYPDPMIGYMLMDSPYKKDPADLSPRSFMKSEFMISQDIPAPGRLSAEGDVAALEVKKARLRVISAANELVSAYLRDTARLWRSQHHLMLTRAYQARFHPILSISGAQYALGKGGLADLAMARLSSRNLEEKEARYAKQYESAVAALKYYGADGTQSQSIEQVRDYATAVLQSAQSIRETAAERSPEVALLALDGEMAARRTTLARFQYVPDFTFFAKYYRSQPGNRPEFGVPLPDNQLNIGMTMRVPLWSALTNHNNVDESAHTETAIDFDRAALARAAETGRETLLADIAGLEERTHLYATHLIPEADRAVLSAREGYQSGRGDFNSVLRMWESLYGLEMESVELQAERLEKIFDLGRLLNTIQPPAILPAAEVLP